MTKSKKSTPAAKKPRVSKEDAVQLFLDATISILKEKVDKWISIVNEY
jgi:hypothetical protein